MYIYICCTYIVSVVCFQLFICTHVDTTSSAMHMCLSYSQPAGLVLTLHYTSFASYHPLPSLTSPLPPMVSPPPLPSISALPPPPLIRCYGRLFTGKLLDQLQQWCFSEYPELSRGSARGHLVAFTGSLQLLPPHGPGYCHRETQTSAVQVSQYSFS